MELTRHIRAPRAAVHRALLDPDDVVRWMVPEGMNLPPGVRPEDNELGWTMSVGKLAALVEGR